MSEVKTAQITKLNILDARLEYIKSIKYDNGFEITSSDNIQKKKPKSIRLDDGIFSRKFGSTWGDDDAFTEKYRCECGKYKSTFNNNRICDNCGTKVQFVDDDLSIKGWLLLYDDKFIIHPILFSYIEGIIGESNLTGILTGPSINKNGVISYEENPDNPFHQIGMTQFTHRFDEILNYFFSKNKKEAKRLKYEHIMNNREKVFIQHIPVYQFKLRPQKIDGDDIFKDKINDDFHILQKNVISLRETNPNELLNTEGTLYKIQKEFNGICDSITNNIYNKSKSGMIRKHILGARLNYSARNVIVSYVDHKRSNEIAIPYLTALELYKPLLMNVLTKVNRITYERAESMLRKAKYRYDPIVYSAMMLMVRRSKRGLRLIINRNPTLSDGSVMCMKVVEIKSDIHDLTMAIPLRVLNKFNADFDGDVMNMIAVFDMETKNDKIKVFDPTQTHYISSNDGRYDSRMNLLGTEAIVLGNLL